MKFVWRTDIHLSVNGPQSRVDDWADTVLGKIEQVGEIAREVGAVAVLDGGDFFHFTEPMRTTHALVHRVMETHHRYPCPVYSCVGNHDYRYVNMDRLNRQPLGVLFEAGVFNRLYREHEATFVENGLKVRVVGVEYHGPKYDLERLRVRKRDEDYLLVVSHLYASPKGTSMYGNEDIVPYTALEGSEVDAYFFGHWHKNQGVSKVGDSLVINVGSLTRGSLTDDEITRVPCCVVCTVTDGGVDADIRPLQVKSPEDVFDLAVREVEAENVFAMNAFMEQLNASLEVPEQKEIREVVGDLKDLPKSVRDRTLYYLDKAGA